jgi:polar amino acid transport system substrate-binding protein
MTKASRLIPFVLCVASLFCVSAGAQQKLRIATEGANPPFSTVDASGALQGFDIDIARALCEKMKAQCEIVAQDWDGIIPALLAKKYDAIIASMSVTEDRKKVVAFTKPYYRSPSVFVARKDLRLTSVTPDALAGKSIGVQSATVHSAFLDDKYPKSDVRLYNTIADAYRDLAAGRVNLVLYDKLAIYDWLKTPEADCCEIVGPDFTDPAYFGSGVAIALRKGDSALAERLDRAIDGIVADGAYAKINAKYFPFPIF